MAVDELLDSKSPVGGERSSELLAEARRRLGFSQKEVADELYLSTAFIEYIDVGEYSSIPKPAFIKGYLRAYARVVELSGDEIVALYQGELQVTEPTPEIKRVTEAKVGTASITGPVLQTGLIGLVGLGLVVAFIWWLVSDPEKKPPLITTQPADLQLASEDSSEVGLGFLLPPQEGVALQSEQVFKEEAVSDQAELSLQLKGTWASRTIDSIDSIDSIDAIEPTLAETAGENREMQAIPMAKESIQETVIEQSISEQSISGQDSPSVIENPVNSKFMTDGTRRFITIDANGPDQLELLFSDECWVEIEDNQFGLIYNDLNQANDRLTIYGTGPFEVLLGKATGVEMIYNDRPFELERFVSRDRTAKLTVSN
jgi:cytoskeleton protein RodZ